MGKSKVIHAEGESCGGEFTACGIAGEDIDENGFHIDNSFGRKKTDDSEFIAEKSFEGINCKRCIEVIKFYRKKATKFTTYYED